MKPIRMLLADDHSIIRDSVRMLLKPFKDIEIVEEVSNGKEAVDYLLAHSKEVDLVLMDINMPVMNGVEATKIITSRFKKMNVLALTMHVEEKYITSMVKAGAIGYILKETDAEGLERAIRTVAKGDKYYSNKVATTLINSMMTQEKPVATDLTERELEVLGYISAGYTNKDVANLLLISARTIETHRRNILTKLGLNNTAEMIRYAIIHKLVA